MSENETPMPSEPNQAWGQPDPSQYSPTQQAEPMPPQVDPTGGSETDSPAWGQGYLGQQQPGAPAPPGPGYGSGAGSGGGSGAGAPSTTNYRGPRGVKTSRFSGMGMPLLTGLGLLGLMVTMLIMVLLMGKVMDGVSPSSGDDSVDLPEVLPGGQILEPDNPTQPNNPAQPGGQQTAAAQAAMCDTNRATLETAATAYQLTVGAPPANQQVLVDEQYLKTVVPNLELSPNGDTFTITGTGPCS